MQSPAELLTELVARFQPSAAGGLKAVYQLELTGNGNGCWHLVVAERQCRLCPGPAERPDVTITVSAEDWGELVSGRLDAFTALASGRLQVEGDLELAMRLQAVFGF
ncbi:MAG: SCP2 sterol-binding domain-containing protein [Armatimonadota bacterium]